jgi:uncharacterized repeat protein (TIGR01451 family)/MYXO-CTERM domain-containing protein
MLGTVTCVTTTLAPGASTTCTAPTYVVTDEDVSSGSITTQASVHAVGGAGTVGGANGDDVVEVITTPGSAPAIKLVKRADTQGPVQIGDKIAYTFTVTNTGDVTVKHLRVSDPMLGAVTCPKLVLEPGRSTTCTAPSYTVTAADVSHHRIVNHASARGTAAGGTRATDADTLVIATKTSGSTHPGPTLPGTGSPVRPTTVVGGFGLLGVGLVLLLAGRRRRKSSGE